MVVEPGCPIDADVVAAVRAGVGVVVLVDQPAGPDNRASDQVGSLLAEAGIELDTEPAAGNARSVRDETAAVTDLDLLARVDPAAADRHRRHYALQSPAAALLRSDTPVGTPVAALSESGSGRVVVLAVRLDGQSSTDELMFNAITYAAGHLRHRRAADPVDHDRRSRPGSG